MADETLTEDDYVYAKQLQAPFSALVISGSNNGKSTFISRLLENANETINPAPGKIIVMVGSTLAGYKDNPAITFIHGFQPEYIPSSAESTPTVLVLDDLYHDIPEDTLRKLYTQWYHHYNLCLIVTTHNLYEKTVRCSRTVNLSTEYFFLFANRDKSSIRCLDMQSFPEYKNFLLSAYTQMTSKPYQYLLFDAKAQTKKILRLRTGLLKSEELALFVPKKT